MEKSTTYRTATIADSYEIQELFNTYYYPNEPFNVGWINNDPVPEDLQCTLESLRENLSIAAVDECTNRIVGACIAGVDTPNMSQAIVEETKKATNKKWSQFLQIFSRIDRESRIYERFNVRKFLHIHALVVDKNYQNNSIGTKLMENCINKSTHSFELCVVNCSNIYTEKIAQKLNMKLISSVPMDSLRDDDGKRLIFPPEPHTHINTYAKHLSNDD